MHIIETHHCCRRGVAKGHKSEGSPWETLQGPSESEPRLPVAMRPHSASISSFTGPGEGKRHALGSGPPGALHKVTTGWPLLALRQSLKGHTVKACGERQRPGVARFPQRWWARGHGWAPWRGLTSKACQCPRMASNSNPLIYLPQARD